MSDAEKFEIIKRIVATWNVEYDDEEGDKYLSDPNLAMQAITTLLDDDDNGILRQFMEARRP